ncbi:15540_t:CDS:1, partial [Funneliformis caledonium]
MTFNDFILFAFSNGASNGKRFIIKSSFDTDVEEYLLNQLI